MEGINYVTLWVKRQASKKTLSRMNENIDERANNDIIYITCKFQQKLKKTKTGINTIQYGNFYLWSAHVL